jgi:hypothetical protein
MESLFDKIKKDVKNGFEEGLAAVKQGASVVSAKMSELTEEGKRQYKMLDLKSKIHSQMTDLGGKTYDVLNKKKNLETDRKIKTVFVKIKKLEAQLHILEAVKKTNTAAPKKPAKKGKVITKKTATKTSKQAKPSK